MAFTVDDTLLNGFNAPYSVGWVNSKIAYLKMIMYHFALLPDRTGLLFTHKPTKYLDRMSAARREVQSIVSVNPKGGEFHRLQTLAANSV